jgi:hypothetical protein
MSRSLAFVFLCGCLTRHLAEARRHEIRQIAQSDDFCWETFVKLAGGSLVAPAVLEAARRNGIDDLLPAEVASFLEGMAVLNRQRNERIRSEAVELAALLNQRGVVPVLLKGGANLLSGLYAGPGDRVMVDIDLLVPESLLVDCASDMREHGYEVVADNGYPASHHYSPMARPGTAAAVELHARPIADPHGGLLSPDEIFATASPMHLGQAILAIPSARARIIHAIAHTQLADHGYLYGRLSLRELLDYALLCETAEDEVDWPDIRSRFEACGGATALGYQALAAQDLLGVRVPCEVRIGKLARMLYRIAIWQVSYPRLLDLKIRLLRPCLLLRRSLSSGILRKKLLGDLRDPIWYRRHWHFLRGTGTHEP